MNIGYICPHCKEHQKIELPASSLISSDEGAYSKDVKRAIEAYKCTNCKQTNL